MFKRIFREFVILCWRLDLFGRELLAVDGTRTKAVNNKDRNFTTGSLQKFIAAADRKLEDYLKRLDAGDAEERVSGGSRVGNLAEKIEALKKKRGDYAAFLSALEKSGESQVSLTAGDTRGQVAAASRVTSRFGQRALRRGCLPANRLSHRDAAAALLESPPRGRPRDMMERRITLLWPDGNGRIRYHGPWQST
ncbi:MAG: hypothetical protein ACREDV_00030 [Methylocella sp.]